jgi:transcriptional regulator with XRE-family HTH domain
MTQEKTKAIMEEYGMTQVQLAKEMHCTAQRISNNLRKGKMTTVFVRSFNAWYERKKKEGDNEK